MRTNNNSGPWCLSKEDKKEASVLLEKLPSEIFDFHMHIGDLSHIDPIPDFLRNLSESFDIELWSEITEAQMGKGRLTGALLTPFPSKKGDINAANDFVLQQMRKTPLGDFRANIIISPASNIKLLESTLENDIAGFKPYHLLANSENTFNSSMDEFIPEWTWNIANERGLLFLIHMVKNTALSDKENLKYILSHAEKFPNAKIVLAHAGRAFNSRHTIDALPHLAGCENIWFDSSAICESEALVAILKTFGSGRLMWGSDFPVSCQRGRCVSIGTGFAWITTDDFDWSDGAFFGEPIQVGLESTRALLSACRQCDLSPDEVSAVFNDTARALLDLN